KNLDPEASPPLALLPSVRVRPESSEVCGPARPYCCRGSTCSTSLLVLPEHPCFLQDDIILASLQPSPTHKKVMRFHVRRHEDSFQGGWNSLQLGCGPVAAPAPHKGDASNLKAIISC
ncbi:hypothetical protein U0070_010168, partial [Myodes glareolus]